MIEHIQPQHGRYQVLLLQDHANMKRSVSPMDMETVRPDSVLSMSGTVDMLIGDECDCPDAFLDFETVPSNQVFDTASWKSDYDDKDVGEDMGVEEAAVIADDEDMDVEETAVIAEDEDDEDDKDEAAEKMLDEVYALIAHLNKVEM